MREEWEASGGPTYPSNLQLTAHLIFDKEGVMINLVPHDAEDLTLKSDLDNLIKSVLDGLNEVAYEDDHQVTSIVAVMT